MKSGVGAGKSSLGPLPKVGHGPRVGYDSRVGSGLSRGPNQKKTTDAAPWSQTWPAPGATLDLDFANNRGFVRGVGQGGAMDAVTFTRASVGRFVNEQGLLDEAANNQPRFDWASTAQLPQNLLRYSQTFTNAAWQLLNGITRTDNAGTAPDGTNTAASIVHSLGNAALYQTVVLPNNTNVTLSIYVKTLTNGATTVLAMYNNSGSTTVGSQTFTTTGSWQRVTLTVNTGTLSGATWFAIGGQSTFSAGEDMLIWGAQLELGDTVTDYKSNEAFLPLNTPLTANPTSNGLLIEESRTNRILWNRDATSGPGTNLVQQSEAFDNAYWTKSRASVSLTTELAPNGTNTADKLIEDNSSSTTHRVFETNAFAAGTYTWSVYAKEAERNWIFLRLQNTVGTSIGSYFDLSNGTIGTVSSGVAANIESAGNGWYRCSITVAAQATPTSYIGIANANNGESYTGDGASGILIWGAQLTPGSTLTDYQVTTTAATQGWSKSNVTVAKDQTGIDGVANAATSITASAANGILIQPISLASGSRTGSVYLKRLTGTGTVQVSLDGSTWSTVDLSDTEWRRIVLSGTVTNPTVGIKIATSGDAVAMDYAQVEDNSSNYTGATTPILTTTAAATRSADVGNNAGVNFTSFYNVANGVFYAEVTPPPVACFGTILSAYVADNANAHNMYKRGATLTGRSWSANTFVTTNVAESSFISAEGLADNFSKVAYSYQRQNFSFAANGILVGSNAGVNVGGVPTPVAMSIGCRGNTFANQLNGTIKRIVYIPKSLTPNALQELTR